VLPRVGRAEVEQVVDAAASGAEEVRRVGSEAWGGGCGWRVLRVVVVVVWRRESQQVCGEDFGAGAGDVEGCGLEVARQATRAGSPRM
jgi:hypothetical protein